MSKSKKKDETPVELAPCFNCGNKVPREEFFCSGCNEVVCDDCDIGFPMGSHDPEEHLEDPLKEEEEEESEV